MESSLHVDGDESIQSKNPVSSTSVALLIFFDRKHLKPKK